MLTRFVSEQNFVTWSDPPYSACLDWNSFFRSFVRSFVRRLHSFIGCVIHMQYRQNITILWFHSFVSCFINASMCSICTSCCLLCKPERCVINLESWNLESSQMGLEKDRKFSQMLFYFFTCHFNWFYDAIFYFDMARIKTYRHIYDQVVKTLIYSTFSPGDS